ncbi:MAG: hypothetical protein JW843_01840 [Candidatus Aminicenantes bacterium]|nr:hypothetical protein [Candidatus Aminicenantes bacterium]
MSEIDVWKGLDRVFAPPDFEDRTLRALRARLRPDSGLQRARLFRWALSGSTAALLLVFAGLNLFVFKGGMPDGGGLMSSDPVHVTEPLNYGREVRSLAGERTVFLLEQVSDTPSSIIRY